MASLLTGATQQFTATAEMSDGSTSTTGFNWSVEGGGAVSVSGLYTAPSTSQETPATITATKSSKKGTATVVKVIDPATIESRGPLTGKIGGNSTAFTTMFTATNSTYSDYNFVITPTSAGTISGSGVFTLSDNASGNYTVKATHKVQTLVTATANITSVAPKATITAKTVGDKVGGDVVPFADMFTSNNAATNFNYVVTPVDAGTVDSSGNFTLSDDPGDEAITVKATHKSQVSVTATCTIVATPKLVGLVVQGVTNAVAVGDINLPSVTDTMTITDPAQPGVFRIDTVFQGALLGTIVYDLAGSEVSKVESVVISADLVTIKLNEPLFSDDTSITLRTDPGSTVFRTYLLYSGE